MHRSHITLTFTLRLILQHVAVNNHVVGEPVFDNVEGTLDVAVNMQWTMSRTLLFLACRFS